MIGVRGRRVLAMAAVATVAVAPAAVTAYSFTTMDDGLASVEPKPVPVLSPSTEVVDDQAASVTVALRWRSGRSILAPDWSGLVTAVRVRRGDSVSEGQAIVTIDGVDRIAAVTEQPFYRSITAGSAGPDVAQLNALLPRLGLPGGSGSTWTGRTAQGIAELRARLGLAPVPRLEVSFDPAWVVRIPEPGVVVGSVSTHVGASAPPVGEPVFEEQKTIAGAAITPAEGESLPDAGATVVEAAKETLDLGDNATLDSKALSALSRSIPLGTESVKGTMRLKTPRTATVVPASAVVVDPDTARQCVFTGGWRQSGPVGVKARESSVGSADIGDAIRPGTEVLVNPLEVAPTRGCTR